MSDTRRTAWAEVAIGELAADSPNALTIGPFGSNLKVKDYRESGVPLVFVRDIRAGSFGGSNTKFVGDGKARELSSHTVGPGDLLVTKMGDPPGDTAIYPQNRPRAVITADCIKLTAKQELTSERFLRHWLRTPTMRRRVQKESKGVAQQKLSLKRFRLVQTPLPPLNEQRRIVAKIESLFERSQRAKQALDAIPPLLDKLRQSILAAAFRGDLTADWRAQNPNVEAPVSGLHEWKPRGGRLHAANLTAKETARGLECCPKSWAKARLGEAAHFFYGFAHKRSEFTPSGMRLLRGANIGTGKTKWDDVVFAAPPLCEPKYALRPNDIVIAMDRPFISGGFRVARISETDCPSSLVQRVARLRPSNAVSVDFLHCFLLSATFQQHLKARVTGSSVPHISGIDIGSAWMPLPPVEEQEAIAESVGEAIARIDTIGAHVSEQATRASTLDASILAKAFRGDLVEQDSSDEAASVLLERIRAAREPAKKKRRSGRVGGKKHAVIEVD